jgi:5-amino-6-(5-phosphoribosylamino)uracil reductase
MISTPDGAIDVNGRSRALGGPADQAHLLALRQRAAVVLVGAGTARLENYGPPSKHGLRIGVVTRSCDVDFSTPLFSSGAGFIVTTATAPDVPVDCIRTGDNKIDFAAVIAQLPHGMIHVEGGPQLNAALFDADVVDAINVTFSPKLVGSRGPSLSQAPHALRRFALVNTELRDNFVFARYERTTTASAEQVRD